MQAFNSFTIIETEQGHLARRTAVDLAVSLYDSKVFSACSSLGAADIPEESHARYHCILAGMIGREREPYPERSFLLRG